MALSISVFLYPFYFTCLSQCLERYREDWHVPAQVLTPINRVVQSSFMLHSFCEFACLFPFSSQGRDFILHFCSQLRTCLADH